VKEQIMARILIVEDEKKIARFLELELKHEGYEVLTAFDGRSGLDTALNEDPDLLILDLMLPELSGIEVCRRLRHTSDVPIIMLTAKDDVSDKVMGLDMGADDYVTKPFAIEELLARMVDHLTPLYIPLVTLQMNAQGDVCHLAVMGHGYLEGIGSVIPSPPGVKICRRCCHLQFICI
jgi:DNA-binding response OmpR family regulator